jgi:heterodisulfide reductase subunit A
MANMLRLRRSAKLNIKVILCTCGDTLNDKLDFKALADYTKNLENVTDVTIMKALCTKSEKNNLSNQLKGAEKLVTLACTRSVCDKPIESAMETAGLDKENYVLVNGKEQIALVHDNKPAATEKAKMLLKAAIAKVKESQPKETVSYERVQEALVVGAGIAGLTAASELADQGFKVHIIEKMPAIGGAMPLISKTYPEEDCTLCLRGPRMIELLTKPKIEYHVNSTIKEVERTSTGFKVTYEKTPIKLNLYEKKGKGLPIEVIPDPSGEYQPVYSEGPTLAALKNVKSSKCGKCASVYPSALFSPEEEPGKKTIDVGSVILATGFEDFDPRGIPKWGYGLDNVITQYQLARLLDPYGPTGGIVVRTSDAKPPKKIVMVQCVGSRDPEYHPYCSKYCCMAAIKHASVVKELKDPSADITILYRDIRASGYGFESLYNNAKDMGIHFIHGDIDSVTPHGNGLGITYTDGMGRTQYLEADMLVLSTGMKPSEGSNELAELFNVELTEGGFFKEIDEKVANITTRSPGVFIAGTATGPKNIPDSIAQAGAAAFMSSNYIRTYLEKKVNHPTVNEDNCGKCGICRSVCPYDAITIPEDGFPQFDPLLCQSCGLCISSCPTRALNTPSFGYDLIDTQAEAILSEKQDKPLIIGFACDDCGYNLLDTAGFTKSYYSSSFIPIYINCMSNLSLRNVLNSIKMGADGVMLIGCVKDRCHFLKGTERSKSQMEIIEDFFKATGIDTPIKILESSGTMVSQFTKALGDMMKDLEAKK